MSDPPNAKGESEPQERLLFDIRTSAANPPASMNQSHPLTIQIAPPAQLTPAATSDDITAASATPTSPDDAQTPVAVASATTAEEAALIEDFIAAAAQVRSREMRTASERGPQFAFAFDEGTDLGSLRELLQESIQHLTLEQAKLVVARCRELEVLNQIPVYFRKASEAVESSRFDGFLKMDAEDAVKSGQ